MSVQDFRFRVANYGALRKLDLVGDTVSVVLIDDASLGLFGEEAGTVRLRPLDIERMRIGVLEGKRRVFSTKIWPADGSKPIELIPPSSEWPSYARVMRHYVTMLANDHKMDRIIVGGSKFDALLLPVLFGLLFTSAVLVSIFALRNEPWWGRLIPPIVPLLVLSISVWVTVERTWPRPLTDLSQLERQLPRG